MSVNWRTGSTHTFDVRSSLRTHSIDLDRIGKLVSCCLVIVMSPDIDWFKAHFILSNRNSRCYLARYFPKHFYTVWLVTTKSRKSIHTEMKQSERNLQNKSQFRKPKEKWKMMMMMIGSHEMWWRMHPIFQSKLLNPIFPTEIWKLKKNGKEKLVK